MPSPRAALVKSNIKVGAPSVGPMSSIKERAENLQKYLEANFANQSVNLIGFSMGGLDARYLISHLKNRSYKILSLATVATPHRGSSFMDFLRDNLGVGSLQTSLQRLGLRMGLGLGMGLQRLQRV